MVPSGRGIQENRYTPQTKQCNQNQIQFRGHGLQQQNTIAWLEIRRSELIGNAGSGNIQFAKTVEAVATAMNVDDSRVVAQFSGPVQQDLGDIH